MQQDSEFKVFIEIPQGTAVKYEVDEETGELMVDRFMSTAFTYPLNYGYIKNTHGQDGDPLDALVFTSLPLLPGVIIKCHAVGMLEMEDEDGVDTKIICVPSVKIDQVYGEWNDIKDVPRATMNKIKHFFENYKDLESGKWVKVKDYKSRADAFQIIKKSVKK